MQRTASTLAATLFAALLTAGIAHAKPIRYDLDPTHTQVQFRWTHFGFSHPGARFDKVDGQFLFDPADPTRSSITVTIPINSIDTGVPALDEHLQTADFFDAEKYPTATFKSSVVERVDDQRLKVSGTLTLHGVSKPVVLDVTVNRVGMYPMAGRAAAGFDATATLKRSDFGIDKFVPNVSDEIALSITTETMVPKPGEAEMPAQSR